MLHVISSAPTFGAAVVLSLSFVFYPVLTNWPLWGRLVTDKVTDKDVLKQIPGFTFSGFLVRGEMTGTRSPSPTETGQERP